MDACKTVGDVGEKELIRSTIKPMLNPTNDGNSVGDDCAIIRASADGLTCFSTDRVPADLISFRLGIISHRELGNYLAVLNLSDIAAMGAEPAGILLNLGLPADTPLESFVAILEGARDACAVYGCGVLGGDLSSSAELSLSATSIGTVTEDKILRRRGASVGDLVYAADPIGMAPTAFAYFLRAKPMGYRLYDVDENVLKDQFRRPRARFDMARSLSQAGVKVAMDNTDGVGQTLFELAEINRVRMRVEAASLPIHPLSFKIAEYLETDPVDLVLSAGADFQLIGTAPRHLSRSSMPRDFRIIGEVVEGDGVTVLTDGSEQFLAVKGWNYFV